MVLTPKKRCTFVCDAPHAKTAAIAGSFNDWSTGKHMMERRKKDGCFACGISLKPGRYEYKFVLDGTEWITDPKAKECCPDGKGGMNCVLNVK
ncbi:MAG TPA: isoamylase early set domain-containing protein [Candidatus Peribacterales bacterium]|nr:isoamylase early set domain-containing protein [Candidatus Peribacterales bacterium]